MEQSVVFWLVAIAGVVLTGISKSGFAGGIGIATVPILSLVMSPVQAAAIMLPLLILMDGFSLKAWWGQ
ncbi:MAG: sulfite exporter TauE/SafE family protein, partial [Pseudomonadota bacterium]|nr:sulfite exporter TauE/SafE family protein [Pseudomonadota bacterium]